MREHKGILKGNNPVIKGFWPQTHEGTVMVKLFFFRASLKGKTFGGQLCVPTVFGHVLSNMLNSFLTVTDAMNRTTVADDAETPSGRVCPMLGVRLPCDTLIPLCLHHLSCKTGSGLRLLWTNYNRHVQSTQVGRRWL